MTSLNPTTKEVPGTQIDRATMIALETVVWDVLNSKGRERAKAVLTKRADGMERYAQKELGLGSTQRPDNVVALWGPKGKADRVFEEAAQIRLRAERGAAAVANAAALRNLIEELL